MHILHLNHHSILDQFQRSKFSTISSENNEYCELRQNLEKEADTYAIVLAMHQIDDGVTTSCDQVDLNDFYGRFLGYQSFLEYGYPLAGFEERPGESCRYPTNKERYLYINESVRQIANNATAQCLQKKG